MTTVILIGCGGVINVPLKSYEPALTGDYGAVTVQHHIYDTYKGKRIYLMNFDNEAEETTVWYYSSKDGEFFYGGPGLIHEYFWCGFHEALVDLGMIVSNVDKPDPTAPAMRMTLQSIDDERFQVRVTIQRGEKTVFNKIYTVEEPRPMDNERTPANLEQRAYRMTDKLFETILRDHEFKQNFS